MEIKDDLVTVVISCYSHKRYFKDALDSVLSQTARDKMRVVIYDNGCAADYRALIRDAVRGEDVQIYEEKENTYGMGFRINLLPTITTKYMAVLHDDDFYSPQKIEKGLTQIERDNLDFLVTNVNFINAYGDPYRGSSDAVNTRPMPADVSRAELLLDMFKAPGLRLHQSTIMIKTSIARQCSFGDPFYPRISDAFFWKDLILNPSVKFCVMGDALSSIRIHGANDRLYSKYGRRRQTEEFFKLGLSEERLFSSILEYSDQELLLEFLNLFLPADRQCDDLASALVGAAIQFTNRGVMLRRFHVATSLIHKAFKIDPVGACRLIEATTGLNANSYMAQLYHCCFNGDRDFILRRTFRYLLGISIAVEEPFDTFQRVGCFCARKLCSENMFTKLRSIWRRIRDATIQKRQNSIARL